MSKSSQSKKRQHVSDDKPTSSPPPPDYENYNSPPTPYINIYMCGIKLLTLTELFILLIKDNIFNNLTPILNKLTSFKREDKISPLTYVPGHFKVQFSDDHKSIIKVQTEGDDQWYSGVWYKRFQELSSRGINLVITCSGDTNLAAGHLYFNGGYVGTQLGCILSDKLSDAQITVQKLFYTLSVELAKSCEADDALTLLTIYKDFISDTTEELKDSDKVIFATLTAGSAASTLDTNIEPLKRLILYCRRTQIRNSTMSEFLDMLTGASVKDAIDLLIIKKVPFPLDAEKNIKNVKADNTGANLTKIAWSNVPDDSTGEVLCTTASVAPSTWSNNFGKEGYVWPTNGLFIQKQGKKGTSEYVSTTTDTYTHAPAIIFKLFAMKRVTASGPKPTDKSGAMVVDNSLKF